MDSSLAVKVAASSALAAAAVYGAYKVWKKVDMGSAIFQRKWFSEFGVMWPGQSMSLEIEEVLYEGKSDFQKVQVFKSTTYGTVLVLDGVIQVTERDEFAYQEMMAHLPLFSHPNPKKVLVIGGGDGGVLREVARHPCIERIDICEIDKMVVDVSKKYLKGMSRGYDDPRVTLYVQDGYQFMLNRKNEYDIIVVDSSDPVGPAEVLFKEPFFAAMAGALREGGIAATQGECMWLHTDVVATVINFSRKYFKSIDYASVSIPTYPCGTIGVLCLSKGVSCRTPTRQPSAQLATDLKYYTSEVHKAAFVLPAFVQRALPKTN